VASLIDIIESLENRGFDMGFTRGLTGQQNKQAGYPTGQRIAGETAKKMLLERSPQLPTTADIFGEVPDQYFEPDTKLGEGINQLLRGAAKAGQFTSDALVRAPLQSILNVGRMYDKAGKGIGQYAMLPTDRKQASVAGEIDQFKRAGIRRNLSPALGIDDELSQLSAALAKKSIPRQTQAERKEMEELSGVPTGGRGSGDFLEPLSTENQAIVNAANSTASGGGDSSTTTTTTGDTTTTTKTTTSGSEFKSGVEGTPEFGVDNLPKDTDEPYNPYGEMLEKAMKDVAALRGKDPDTVTREEYMKEFAEATGVNISGEPDKSHALMAFGLALMQNKAGKGFDVSKMLGAVGEAGEKAMPAFQKAKEQARAERIAAGKYALGEVKADAAARAASLKDANARVNDLMKATIDTQAKIDLEGLKHKNKVELKIAELEVKAAEDAQKGKYDYKNTKTIEDKGLPGFKTTIGIRQTDGQSVYINAEDEIGVFASALADVNEGADSLNLMKRLIVEEAKKPGGTNVSRAKSFLEGVGRSFKFNMDQVPIFEEVTRKNEETGEEETVEVFTGRYEEKAPAAGALQTVDAIRDRVIAQFKRFLTQETGNGISNVDIQNIQNLLGKIDFGSDPALAIARIDEAMKIFESKKSKLENRISMYGNADRHRNQASYQETMRIGRDALAQAYKLDPKVFRPSGTVEGDVEVFKLY